MLPNSSHPFNRQLASFAGKGGAKPMVPFSPSQTMARFRPSGDRLQLHDGSICGGSECLPVCTSKRTSGWITCHRAIQQIAEGKGEHCTFQIPNISKNQTRRSTGYRNCENELGVFGSEGFGVEIYKIRSGRELLSVAIAPQSWSSHFQPTSGQWSV